MSHYHLLSPIACYLQEGRKPSLRRDVVRITCCVLFFGWTGVAVVAQDTEKAPAEEKELEVDLKKVIDGDSILVTDPNDNHKEYEVQVEGIDAPEAKQEFGKESTEGLIKLLEKKKLRIQWKAKDNFDRLLGQIYVGEKHVNAEMLKAGLAWHFKRYNKSEVLAKLEEEAKEAKKGLWAAESPKAPWDFRKDNRTPDKPAK